MQSGHMQTNGRPNERRNHASPRVPVDLLVELRGADERAAKRSDRMTDVWSATTGKSSSHVRSEDAYDADALDVSATGLRMRSSVLPDVGQRLRCRFELPESEDQFEAEGEVVWSSDEGGHQGEFGLRFDSIGKRTSEMLKGWTLARGRADGGPTTLPGEDEARAFRSLGPARVSLEGVASAMECDVVRRDETCLDVMQALPFLELGKLAEVLADGSMDRRRLEHVSLRVVNGIPHLVLSLVAEASSAGGILAPSMDDTAFAGSPHGEPLGADSTLQDEAVDQLLAQRSVRSRMEIAPSSRERVMEPVRAPRIEAKSESAWVTEEAPPSDELDANDAVQARTERDEDEESSVSREDESVEIEAPSKRLHSKRALFRADESGVTDPSAATHRKKKLDEVRRVLLDGEELPESDELAAPDASALDAWKERANELREKVSPAFLRMTTALRTGWAAFVAGVGPRAKSAWEAFSGWIARLAATVSEQLKTRAPKLSSVFARGTKEKRRTTVAPAAAREATQARRATRGANGAVVARPSTQPAAAVPTRPIVPLRYVLAGVVALGAVGALAYAFGSGSDEPAPIDVPSAMAPAALTEEPEMTAEPMGSVSVASTPSPSVPLVRTEPSAMPQASTDEGRLPLPGYPSIGRAPTDSASATPTASAAPTRAPVVGRNFGAEHVEDGRMTALQMTLVPTALEGQADPNGFTVTVRGALSETRAAQIARTNPAVDRASVINRGDHCVLDVRFVEGRTPAYRVAIVNQTVEVTIGH